MLASTPASILNHKLTSGRPVSMGRAISALCDGIVRCLFAPLDPSSRTLPSVWSIITGNRARSGRLSIGGRRQAESRTAANRRTLCLQGEPFATDRRRIGSSWHSRSKPIAGAMGGGRCAATIVVATRRVRRSGPLRRFDPLPPRRSHRDRHKPVRGDPPDQSTQELTLRGEMILN